MFAHCANIVVFWPSWFVCEPYSTHYMSINLTNVPTLHSKHFEKFHLGIEQSRHHDNRHAC